MLLMMVIADNHKRVEHSYGREVNDHKRVVTITEGMYTLNSHVRLVYDHRRAVYNLVRVSHSNH